MDQLTDITIDADGRLSKYEQVKRVLIRFIEQAPEEVEYLPYEHVIEEDLKIGRSTVRRALADLREDGYIETVRNRGSRILRRHALPREATPAASAKAAGAGAGAAVAGAATTTARHSGGLVGQCLGAIFLSDKDGTMPTGSATWQVVMGLESLLPGTGGRLFAANLRSGKWAGVPDMLDQMEASGVRWCFVAAHAKLDLQHLLPMLLARGIKPAALIPSTQEWHSWACDVIPGTDGVLLNDAHAYGAALPLHFADVDAVATVEHTLDDWFEPRCQAVQRWAEQQAKPVAFHRLVTDIATPPPEGDRDRSEYYHRETGRVLAAEAMARLKGARRPLIIAANDVVASGVLKGLETLGVSVPGTVELIGFDNMQSIRFSNLSTFDPGLAQTSQLLLELALQHYADPDTSLQRSEFRIAYTEFIHRQTTVQA